MDEPDASRLLEPEEDPALTTSLIFIRPALGLHLGWKSTSWVAFLFPALEDTPRAIIW